MRSVAPAAPMAPAREPLDPRDPPSPCRVSAAPCAKALGFGILPRPWRCPPSLQRVLVTCISNIDCVKSVHQVGSYITWGSTLPLRTCAPLVLACLSRALSVPLRRCRCAGQKDTRRAWSPLLWASYARTTILCDMGPASGSRWRTGCSPATLYRRGLPSLHTSPAFGV
jgi:hypothetical protein